MGILAARECCAVSVDDRLLMLYSAYVSEVIVIRYWSQEYLKLVWASFFRMSPRLLSQCSDSFSIVSLIAKS